MSKQWPQMRPQWCPHVACQYRVSSQNALCFGQLPEPEAHGDGINTHRMCLRGAKDDGEWTMDLQINRGDAWAIVRLLSGLFGFKSFSAFVPLSPTPPHGKTSDE